MSRTAKQQLLGEQQVTAVRVKASDSTHQVPMISAHLVQFFMSGGCGRVQGWGRSRPGLLVSLSREFGGASGFDSLFSFLKICARVVFHANRV